MQEDKKPILYKKGKLYYDKETERRLFFILTIMMLILGILAKFGLL